MRWVCSFSHILCVRILRPREVVNCSKLSRKWQNKQRGLRTETRCLPSGWELPLQTVIPPVLVVIFPT